MMTQEDPCAHVDIALIEATYPQTMQRYLRENMLVANRLLDLDAIEYNGKDGPTLCPITGSTGAPVRIIHVGNRSLNVNYRFECLLAVAAELLKQGCWPDFPGMFHTYYESRWMRSQNFVNRRLQIAAQLDCTVMRGQDSMQIISARLESCYQALQRYRRVISREVASVLPTALADIVASYAYLTIRAVDQKLSGLKSVVWMISYLEAKSTFIPAIALANSPEWMENSPCYRTMSTWWHSKQW